MRERPAGGVITRPEANDGSRKTVTLADDVYDRMQQEAEAAGQTVEMCIEDWQPAPVEPSDLAKRVSTSA